MDKKIHNCLKILECTVDAGRDELRKSYHRLAMLNHPDMHPEEVREYQNIKMLEINRAYMTLCACIETSGSLPVHEADRDETPAPDAEKQEAEPSRDAAYALYKSGFDLYQSGLRIFHRRFKIPHGNRIRNIFLGKKDLLELAFKALSCFEASYRSFLKVTQEHPESIWCADCQDKMRRLEQINEVYSRICRTISSNSS